MAAELKIGIGADNSGLKKGLQDAEAQISSFVSKIGKIAQVGEQLSSIGQKMTVGLTLPIAGLAAGALNAFKELEGVRVAFNRLNDPTLLDELRKATKNTTTDLQLMQSAVSAEKFGLSVSALPKLLEYARRVAKDTGQSVDYLVDSIVTGIGRKSALILDNLGISATSLKEALGGVTMEAASVGQVTEAVAKIAQQELKKMGADANTLAESWAQVRTSITNSLGRIGEVINKNFNISGVIDKIAGFIDKAVSAFENLNPAIQQAILVVAGLAAAAGPLLVVVGGIMQAIPTVVAGLGAFKIALVALTGPIGLVVAGIAGIIAIVVSQWDKIKPYIQGTIKWFQDLYKESAIVRLGVQSIGFAFNALYQVVKGALNAIWGYIKSFGKAVLETFAGIGDVIMGAFTLSPEKISSGFQRINRAFVTGLSEVISTTQRAGQNIFKGIFGLDKADVSGKEELTKKVEKTVTDAVTTGVTAANVKIKTGVKIELPDIEPLTQNTAGFMNNLGETFDTLEEMDNRSSEIFERMGQGVQSFVTKFSDETLRLQELTMRFNESFTAIWQGAMADTISNAFSAMGEAMTNGGNVFESFGSAVLNGISGFLGQLGELMIQYGLAASVFGKLEAALLSSPDPFTKIAAGLAMVAAGATLSMLGGAIKGAISGGSRGSGGSTSSAGGYSSGYSTRYSSGGASGGGGEYTFRISGYDLIATIDRNRNRLDRLT